MTFFFKCHEKNGYTEISPHVRTLDSRKTFLKHVFKVFCTIFGVRTGGQTHIYDKSCKKLRFLAILAENTTKIENQFLLILSIFLGTIRML